MSNNLAVKAYLERMKSKGYRTLSFLVHKNDEKAVRQFAQELKAKRQKYMIITPKETIDRLRHLNLSDEQFSRVHHYEKTTLQSHLKYLKSLSRGYQLNRNNYVVAQRLAVIEQLMNNGVSPNQTIQQAIKDFPLAER